MHLSAGTSLAAGLAGGVIIGVASSSLLALSGKITGISGIVHSLVHGRRGALGSWRVSFVAGLMAAGTVLWQYQPAAFGGHMATHPTAVVAAGLLAGWGTRLSGGCTSGHGVCGLPRRSPRSLAAVMTFMATGAATAYATRGGLPGLAELVYAPGAAAAAEAAVRGPWILVPTLATLAACAVLFRRHWMPWLGGGSGRAAQAAADAKPAGAAPHVDSWAAHAAALACGAVFGVGLGVSGMTNPDKVLQFLDFGGAAGWDPSLAAVMGGAVLINLATFHALAARPDSTPLLAAPADAANTRFGKVLDMGVCPANTRVDARLLGGAAMFGVGWGLAGVCPGPAIVSLAAGRAVAAYMVPAMLVGMAAYEVALGEGTGARQHHHHAHSHGHSHGMAAQKGQGLGQGQPALGLGEGDARHAGAGADGLRQRQATPEAAAGSTAS
jgi:uncharacterized membrane protein YedE/YeeE